MSLATFGNCLLHHGAVQNKPPVPPGAAEITPEVGWLLFYVPANSAVQGVLSSAPSSQASRMIDVPAFQFVPMPAFLVIFIDFIDVAYQT